VPLIFKRLARAAETVVAEEVKHAASHTRVEVVQQGSFMP
jgi:hypothetical protein